MSDCEHCGRPVTKEGLTFIRGSDFCFRQAMGDAGFDDCQQVTIERLKARVGELEAMVGPRLHVWELSNGKEVWVVAATEEECWGYLEDQHGDTDEVAEHKENGASWTRLPADKKITLMVDEDGDICELECGSPCAMPAWVWAVRHGAGFLAETE